MQDRVQIRRQIREARRRVPPETRARWSRLIGQRVAHLSSFQQAMRIGGFLAFDGEADPLELMSVAVASGKQVFVPIVTGKSKPLLFAPWRPEIQLQPNRFGIPEPVGVKTEWRLASELDFVIHPLVAFDNSCGRIGVGGGFYDRSFAFLNEPNVNKKDDAQKIHLVGFAFELQKIPSIDIQPWDVRLTDVVTESARYTSPDVGGV